MPRAFLAVGCGLSKVAGVGSFEEDWRRGVVDPWRVGAGLLAFLLLLLGEVRSCDRVGEGKSRVVWGFHFFYTLHSFSRLRNNIFC